jgi:hypothetical protein
MRTGAWLGTLALALVGGGCATGSGTVGADAVGVEVRNDLIPSSAITVYVIPESGARRLVGNVSPGQTKRLTFDDFSVGQYRMMARTTGGAEIVSNPIGLDGVKTIRWSLSSNLLAVTETRG